MVLPEVSEPEPEVGRGLCVGGLPVGVVSLSGEDEHGFSCDGLFVFCCQQWHCCPLRCLEYYHLLLFIVQNQVTDYDMSMSLRTVLVGRRSRVRGGGMHGSQLTVLY